MARYFVEVLYKGTNYAGFQIQNNANSIQAEVEKALTIFFKHPIELTGSSRTDSGVHALKNYFHFDMELLLLSEQIEKYLYNFNSILPPDIVINSLSQVADNAHCRFDAISRYYNYFIYQHKNPFIADVAYYYPYKLDIDKLNQAASMLLSIKDFTSFSKKHTQVNNFNCALMQSFWARQDDKIVYHVEGNRFLRGMVRGLVGTMLKVGIGKISIEDFFEIIEAKNSSLADFSVPPQGLFLVEVKYPIM